jgi:hypothetical protein
MRKVTAVLVVALAAAVSTPALAQDKAADVLAGVRKAIGGGKLDTMKTFSMQAQMARNIGERQLTSDIELYLELPDKYLRVENVTAPVARTSSMGFNGDKVIRPAGAMGGGGNAFVIMNGMPMGGGGGGAVQIEARVAGGGRGGGAAPNATTTPEQEAMMNNQMLRSQRVDLSRYMLGWFGTAHPGLNVTYTYAGEAESPDGKAHVINVKADGGFDVKLFVDQATNLPLMLTYEAPEARRITLNQGGPGAGPAGAVPPPPPPPPGAGAHAHPPAAAAPPAQMTQEQIQKHLEELRKTPPKMIEHRIYFTDWKEADGILFPHMLQRAVGGSTTEEWTIGKIKVNPRIDAKKFAVQ